MTDFTNITAKDIIMMCSGTDDLGMSKCQVSVSNEMWGVDGSVRLVDSLSFSSAVVNIYNGGKYFNVDLTFTSANDPDFRMLVDALEKFTVPENSIDDDATEFPSTVLCLIPNECQGKFYVLASCMIYWHQHIEKYDNESRTIRMLFDESDFVFYQNDTTNSDGQEG